MLKLYVDFMGAVRVYGRGFCFCNELLRQTLIFSFSRYIASQGDTIEEARNNLIEALELFFETADPSEIQQRLHTEVFVTRLEVNIG